MVLDLILVYDNINNVINSNKNGRQFPLRIPFRILNDNGNKEN